MKVKTLRALGRDCTMANRIHALAEGGEDWRRLLGFWLPTTVMEPTDVKDERHKWATYSPHLPLIVNLLLGSLFADPPTMDGLPDDVWQRLESDCDRARTSWASFFRDRVSDAVLYRRAWTWVDVPRSEVVAQTAAQENEVLSRVYLRAISDRSVMRWSCDATGALEAVLFHDCVEASDDIVTKPTKVLRWTAIDSTRIRRWTWSPSESEPEPTDESEAVQEPEIVHGFGRIPVCMYELNDNQWMGKRLHDPCVAHIRASNELAWTIHRAAHEMLVVISRTEMKTPTVGTLRWLQLRTHETGPADKAEYIGPSGVSIDKQIAHEQTARTELYRAAQMLHIAANPTAAGALQSAEAKARDMEATALLLESLTDGAIDYMTEVGKVIGSVLGLPDEQIADIKAGGLRGEEDKSPTAWMEARSKTRSRRSLAVSSPEPAWSPRTRRRRTRPRRRTTPRTGRAMLPSEAKRRADLSDRWLSARLDRVRADVDESLRRSRIDLGAALRERWPDGDAPVTVADIAEIRRIVNAQTDARGRTLAGLSIQARQDLQARAVEDVARVWAMATSGEMREIVDLLTGTLPDIATDPAQHARDLGAALGRHAVAAAVQRESRAVMIRRLDVQVRAKAPRISTSLDVDASLAYHAAAQTSMEVASVAPQQQVQRVEFMKRDVEIDDIKTNHPISRVLNGQTVKIQAPFRAKVSDVEREAALMGRSTGASGVLWSLQSDSWVGLTLPAHYNERGRVQMIAKSWMEG